MLNEQDQARIAELEKLTYILATFLRHKYPNQYPAVAEIVSGHYDKMEECLKELLKSEDPIAPVEPNTIAQTEPIKEERWKITIEPFKYNQKDHRIALALTTGNILSEAEANEIADKIKQLLKEL